MGLTRHDAFPSRYLSQADITRPIRATIGNVWMDEIQGDHGNENKVVMGFTDQGIKPMIVNTTNWDICEGLYGGDTDGWMGKPVEIYVDPSVRFGTKVVGGLRLRAISGAVPAVNTVAAPPQDSNPLTKDEAFALAAEHGLDQASLINRLKTAGLTSWAQNPGQATLIVKAMIGEMGNSASVDGDIPF